MRKIFTILLMLIGTMGLLNAQNMTFNNMFATHPDTNICFVSQNQVKLLKATVNMTGSANPLMIEKAWFTYTGTDNDDIKALRVFYMDNSPLLLTDTLEGSIYNPGNSIEYIFPAGSYLSAGDNNVWIGVDIDINAMPANRIDLRLDSAQIDGVVYSAGTGGNPQYDKQIVHPSMYDLYCNVDRIQPLNYAIGTKLIKFGTINNATITYNGTPSAVQFYPSPIPTMFVNKTYPITVKFGELNSQGASVFIDWNNDGAFTSSETVKTWMNLNPLTTINDNISMPCNATTGYHRMRVTSEIGSMTPAFCGITNYGEVEDYLIYIPAEGTPQVSFTPLMGINYVGALTTFIPTASVEGNIDFYWDYDNDGIWDDSTAGNGEHIFTTPGLKTVGLKAILKGCYANFSSSIFKDTVSIFQPSGKPEVNFISSLNTVTPAIPVDFTDLSTNGVNIWKWEIFPVLTPNGDSAYTFYPSNDVRNPSVLFHYPGNYDVKLVASNLLGTDSVLKDEYITVVRELFMCIDNSTNWRSGYLYDEGGRNGVYKDPSNGVEGTCTFLIKPKCAASVTLDFLDFSVCSYGITSCPLLLPDNLKIYDGIDNTGAKLHHTEKDILGNPLFQNGFTNGPGNTALLKLPNSVTATSGSMYLEFYVNCAAIETGFELKWTTQTLIPPPPKAAISGPTTLYRMKSYQFTSQSTGVDLDYFWDLTGDGYTNSIDSMPSWVYTKTGTYNVRLIIQSCESFDTAYLTVTVIDPLTPPMVDFTADITRATNNDPITFTNQSDQTIYSSKWSITPSTFTFLDGTDENSENIKVKFNKIGLYSVKLVAENGIGKDSVHKVDYISIYENCRPGVANLSSDLGMAEVVLRNIAGDTLIVNKTAVGVAAFTDYSQSLFANVYFTGKYNLTLKRNTDFNNITWSVFIDYNQNGMYESSEKVAELANSALMSWTTTIDIPQTGAGIYAGLSKMRIVANAGVLQNKGCGPNYSGEYEDYGLFIKSDNVKPLITLLDLDSMVGGDTVILNSCAQWIDPGYYAWDDVSGDLTSKVIITGVNGINNQLKGYYPLTYSVIDNAGNTFNVIRIVEVLPDVVDPTITLLGNNPDMVPVFSASWNDPGYNVTDNCSGVNSFNSTGTVNTNVVGEYIITYDALDNAGNTAIKERKVIVYDDIEPQVTLNGTDTIYLDVFDEFIDPGVSITDNYYTNLEAQRTGTFDITKIGHYILTYCVTDPSGNGPACVNRILIVQDKEAPKITFNNTVYLVDVFSDFILPAYDLTDNYWPLDKVVLTKTGSVNTSLLGDYILSFVTKDASGNVGAPVQITVSVVDRVAPHIQLEGSSFITVLRWKDDKEPGYISSDNYYLEKDLILQPNAGTYENTQQVGLYTKTYQVCDPSNNCSEVLTRFIYVIDDVSIAENLSEDNFNYYPNPAKDEVNIEVEMPGYEYVSISIFDALGEKVIDVNEGYIMKENYKVNLDNISSGIYYIRFNVGSEIQFNKKLVITK